MKSLMHRPSGLFTNLLIIFFIVGCAGETIKADLPANHPANPDAQEAEFIPPPNPFRQDVTAMKRQPAPDSMMEHETHGESSMQHMDHNMGMDKKSQSDSEPTMTPKNKKGAYQHKGHRQ